MFFVNYQVYKFPIFQLSCLPVDVGFPAADNVRWYQNGLEIRGRSTFVLKIEEAEVKSAGNYTCVPFNKVGMSEKTTEAEDGGEHVQGGGFAAAHVEVHAAPRFVQRLPVYSGKKC